MQLRSSRVKQIRIAVIAGLLCSPLFGEAQSSLEIKESKSGPSISVDDVDRFYRVYDAAEGHPTAENLQQDYLDRGSEDLARFAKMRHVSGASIASNLERHPEMYSNARHCADALPRARERLTIAFRRFSDRYPEALFPRMTVVIGHGKPVAVGSPVSGVQIGLETLCAVKWYNRDLADRFVHVIAHEYVHVQQVPALVDDEHPTVLEASLMEGAADFIGELISGGIAYAYPERTDLKDLETFFASEEDKTDLSKWLYNSTMDIQRDLGYWIGYRIVKCFYQHTVDKREAVREILQISDPKVFLAASGWYPGIPLT